jgi:hypothetical protein
MSVSERIANPSSPSCTLTIQSLDLTEMRDLDGGQVGLSTDRRREVSECCRLWL